MIPPFDERGNLPPGIHKASWAEIEARFGATPWRRSLLLGLRDALERLRSAGAGTVYLDGSFVTSKVAPADFDACWSSQGVDIDALDPVFLDFARGRERQKGRFRGEFLPADAIASPPGIRALDFFQGKHTSRPKGIVELELEAAL